MVENLCNELPVDGELHDFLTELLHKEARLYVRFWGRGDYGSYHIDIRGLGGIYLVSANEFDNAEYFSSLEDAESYIKDYWGDSLNSWRGRHYREPFTPVSPIATRKSRLS